MGILCVYMCMLLDWTAPLIHEHYAKVLRRILRPSGGFSFSYLSKVSDADR